MAGVALINFSNLQGDALEKVGHSRRVCNFLPRLKLNCFTSKRGKKRNFESFNQIFLTVIEKIKQLFSWIGTWGTSARTGLYVTLITWGNSSILRNQVILRKKKWIKENNVGILPSYTIIITSKAHVINSCDLLNMINVIWNQTKKELHFNVSHQFWLTVCMGIWPYLRSKQLNQAAIAREAS